MTDKPRERPEAPLWWQQYAGEFPDWQAWRGVSGQLYARKLEEVPPVVVHAESPAQLRDQIVRAESGAKATRPPPRGRAARG